MDIGKRIKYLRKFRKLTQVQFGTLLGFHAGMSPRVAQYEGMKRIPRSEMRNKISEVLGVNPKMLENADEDEKTEILKQLLWLDEKEAVEIFPVNGRMCICVKDMDMAFARWCGKKHMLANGAITKEEYFEWKMNCPDLVVTNQQEIKETEES